MRINIVSVRRFGESLLATLLVVIVLSAPACADPIRIIVFGDSLTSGYQLQADQAFPAILEQKLRSDGYDVEVLNMSIPGETTSGGVARLQQAIGYSPDIVVLELGANDALRGIPIETIHNNLYQMVSRLNQHQISVVLCGMKAPPNLGRTYASRFNQLFTYYDDKAMVYPFFLKDVATHPEYNLADGYHPNAGGVRVIVNNIYPYITPVVKQRMAYREKLREYKE